MSLEYDELSLDWLCFLRLGSFYNNEIDSVIWQTELPQMMWTSLLNSMSRQVNCPILINFYSIPSFYCSHVNRSFTMIILIVCKYKACFWVLDIDLVHLRLDMHVNSAYHITFPGGAKSTPWYTSHHRSIYAKVRIKNQRDLWYINLCRLVWCKC